MKWGWLALVLVACGAATTEVDAGSDAGAEIRDAGGPETANTSVERADAGVDARDAATLHPGVERYPFYDEKPVCNCTAGTWKCDLTEPLPYGLGKCPKPGRTACAMAATCAPCGPNEGCYTSLIFASVAPGHDGRPFRHDDRADDVCHRYCELDTDCPSGEHCKQLNTSECRGDVVFTKGMCCRDGECTK